MARKNMLIIGLNGSIARNIAKRFYSQGYNIIGITHSSKPKEELEDYVDKVYEADIRNVPKFEEVCLSINAELDTLSAIIYCSGVTIPNAVNEMSLENWEDSMQINLRGYFLTIKYLYDLLMRSPGCSVVQLNSKTGKKGSFKNCAYAASKFGGIGLTQSFALEFAPHKIRFNAVCPGNVFESNTWQHNLFENYARTQNLTPEAVKDKYINLVPMKRSRTYEDVINMVEFLISDKSSYITGQSLVVDGGQTMF